jgi:putative membrane protein
MTDVPEDAAGEQEPGDEEPDDEIGAAGRPVRHAESEPDPRFTLANQRTFLAWSRTALALVAAGLGIVQLLPPFPGVPDGRHIIGVPLILLGATVAAASYWEMTRNQLAMRQGQPLPRSVLPGLLAITIGCVALAAAVIVLLSVTR